MKEAESAKLREQPKCITVVICNQVIEDKRTNNKTLVGLFNRVEAIQLPAVLPSLFTFISLTGGRGKWTIAVRIVHLNSQKEVGRLEGELEFQDPMLVYDIVTEWRNLPLAWEGIYAVDVLGDGKLLAERRFEVQKAQGGQPPC